MDFDSRIKQLDLGLFDYVFGQTAANDRRSLLCLQLAARECFGPYCYLEIGSYKGGSLQPFVADPLCSKIISIDPRPDNIGDERVARKQYVENSVQGMLDGLRQVPGADLGKIQTFDVGTERLSGAQIQPRPNLCFVDGEHTDEAALRDGLFCLAAAQPNACIFFHDVHIVHAGVSRFLDHLASQSIPFEAYNLADYVFIVEIRECPLRQHQIIQDARRRNYQGLFACLGSTIGYRRFYNRPLFQVLRRLSRMVRTGPVFTHRKTH